MADTEHRVEALEQEVEILKNQIQATLLSIQEHLLTHAHPELRPESAPPSEQPPGSGPSAPYARMQTISANPQPETSPSQSIIAAPQARATAPQAAAVDWKTMAELEEWTSNRIDKMGAEQTRALIGAYAQKGRFSPEIANALLEFVSVYENSMAPTIPHRPASFNPVARPKPAQPVQAAPVVKAVAQPPKQPTASPKRPAQPAKPASAAPRPAESNGKVAASKTQAQNRKVGSNQSAPKAAKQTTPATDTEAGGEQSSNLVLRLIAGVSNAGAGVKWKKSHG
jgi:hypothetical protein